MIVYQPAFDLYHTIFRTILLLSNIKGQESIEIERLRIWDFYLLFPNKMADIKLKRDENDVRKVIQNFILRNKNPFENIPNKMILFEKIKPYQMTAIKCLASYGIINKDYIVLEKIVISSLEKITTHIDKLYDLSVQEENTLKLLRSHFLTMSLYGKYGLKWRTGLLESKYDA